jgi:hypothetical protein
MSDEKAQVEAARAAFINDFDRYAELKLDGRSLSDAEGILAAVNELKIRHTGKKSAIASAKKLIGKVPAEERGEFGQIVQREVALDGPCVLRDGFGERFFLIELILNLADQFFQNIFQRHHADRAAVFVDHEGHVKFSFEQNF